MEYIKETSKDGTVTETYEGTPEEILELKNRKEIVSQINESENGVKINAKNIDLQGCLTVYPGKELDEAFKTINLLAKQGDIFRTKLNLDTGTITIDTNIKETIKRSLLNEGEMQIGSNIVRFPDKGVGFEFVRKAEERDLGYDQSDERPTTILEDAINLPYKQPKLRGNKATFNLENGNSIIGDINNLEIDKEDMVKYLHYKLKLKG